MHALRPDFRRPAGDVAAHAQAMVLLVVVEETAAVVRAFPAGPYFVGGREAACLACHAGPGPRM